MPNIRFTKKAVDAIEHPASGQILYRDNQLRGFGLRVGAQSKVYFAEGQVRYRSRRVSIGRADVISVDAARKRALSILSDMSAGVDPTAEKRRAEREGITVEKAFERFFTARKTLQAVTVETYSRSLSLYLKDWRKRPIVAISRTIVMTRHQQIAKKHGEVTANNAMRYFRSVYNVTAASFDDFPPNPVIILTQARAWFPERRRRNLVSAEDLPAWWAAVQNEPEYSRDYLLMALFTGMRRNEIAKLRWEHIDLKKRSLHLPRTKNGDPLDLPLSDFVADLLQKRSANRKKSPWVFPGPGKSGHLMETKKFTSRVTERSGVDFTLHDLRRTFISIAESLDIPHYALKRMLNHRISGDVTGGYIVIDVERLRQPFQAVADRILEQIE